MRRRRVITLHKDEGEKDTLSITSHASACVMTSSLPGSSSTRVGTEGHEHGQSYPTFPLTTDKLNRSCAVKWLPSAGQVLGNVLERVKVITVLGFQ